VLSSAGSPSAVGARLDIDEEELSRIEELLDSIFTPTPVELVKIVLYRRRRRRGILRSRETETGSKTRGDGAETGSRMDSVCSDVMLYKLLIKNMIIISFRQLARVVLFDISVKSWLIYLLFTYTHAS